MLFTTAAATKRQTETEAITELTETKQNVFEHKFTF